MNELFPIYLDSRPFSDMNQGTLISLAVMAWEQSENAGLFSIDPDLKEYFDTLQSCLLHGY